MTLLVEVNCEKLLSNAEFLKKYLAFYKAVTKTPTAESFMVANFSAALMLTRGPAGLFAVTLSLSPGYRLDHENHNKRKTK